MRDHGGIFIPRTLYLYHQEQNKDIVHFSEFKRMESREQQAIQTVLITVDWRTSVHARVPPHAAAHGPFVGKGVCLSDFASGRGGKVGNTPSPGCPW